MAKQSKQVRGEIQNEGRRIESERGGLNDILYGRLPQARERGDQSYNDIYGGYKGALDRAQGPGDFSRYFKDFATTGGLTDENRRRMRGGGVFDEFSKTGGLSEGDISNLRARGTQGIGSFYDAMRDDMRNQSRISGASPSFTSSMSRLAREKGRGVSGALLDAEGNIIDTRNKGRMWGAGSMSDAEQALAGLESANKRFGMGGGADYERGRSSDVLAALSGMRGLRSDVPGEESNLLDMIMRNISGREGAAGGNIGQRMQYDPNVSWFDRLMRIWNQASNNARSGASLAGTL